MSKLKPIALLVVYVSLLIVGTPGLDFLNAHSYPKHRRVELSERWGYWPTALGMAIVDLNRSVRRPIARRIGKFQPVFRIRQSWHLYRDGPRSICRLEIRVDGEAMYRTNDPQLDWLAGQLGNRRVRPMVETTTKKFKSANWRGLSRYVVAQARAEWPAAQTVELVALSGRRPGKRLRPIHRISAIAPDWEVVKTK